jgi:phospholipase C
MGFGFGRLGPRVPCLLISPWLEAGTVVRPPDGRFADHTSLIATALRRWGLAALTARDRAAWDLLGLPWLPQARDDTVPEPPAPPMLAAALPGDPLDPTALEGLSGVEVARRVAEPDAIRDTAGQPMTIRAPITSAETGEPRALTLEESLHLLAGALPHFAAGRPT